MSKHNIKLAHGSREMPETSNPTWKDEEIETSDNDNETDTNDDNNGNSADDVIEPAPPAYIGHQIPEDFLIKAGLMGDDSDDEKQIKPLYDLNADGSIRGRFDSFLINIFQKLTQLTSFIRQIHQKKCLKL